MFKFSLLALLSLISDTNAQQTIETGSGISSEGGPTTVLGNNPTSEGGVNVTTNSLIEDRSELSKRLQNDMDELARENYQTDETDPMTTPDPTTPPHPVFDPNAARLALNDFLKDLTDHASDFTRSISPAMAKFAERMEAAGFPSPLIHGFREIDVPENSILPSFLPNIPSMGPLNPASWSQQQINSMINPPNLFSGLLNPNTITEIPGIGRFSLSLPPQPAEGPLTNLLPNGISIPTFIKYERIPGDAPAYLNIPELGLMNPANAYAGHTKTTGPLQGGFQGFQTGFQGFQGFQGAQGGVHNDSRQLSVAGDLIQSSFDRLTDIMGGTGSGTSGGLSGLAGGLAGGLTGGGILGQNVIDPVLSMVRRSDIGGGSTGGGLLSSGGGLLSSVPGGGLLSSLLDRTQRIGQN